MAGFELRGLKARQLRQARAFPYLLTAADSAVAMGANQEAIGHLEVALPLARDHAVPKEQVAALRLKLAGLHFIVGER